MRAIEMHQEFGLQHQLLCEMENQTYILEDLGNRQADQEDTLLEPTHEITTEEETWVEQPITAEPDNRAKPSADVLDRVVDSHQPTSILPILEED